MKTKNIGFLGGGRITRILLQAFKNKAVVFESVKVYDPDTGIANELKNDFPDIDLASSPGETASQEIVVLAVHPPVMMEAIEKIKESVSSETVVLSLAPKITIGKMAATLPTTKIMRMIPNATSFINKGYNPITFHASFSSEEKKILLHLFKKAGKTIEVEESKLEGYAIISAMLPTYFWFQWKKMEEIAVKTGFTEEEAKKTLFKNKLAGKKAKGAWRAPRW